MTLSDILAKYPRLAIHGGPKHGKTTLAQRITDRPVLHTDDHMNQPWDAVPELVADECARFDRFAVEGVRVASALRNGLEVDCVLVMTIPKAELTPGQLRMARGCSRSLYRWLTGPHMRATAILYEEDLSL